MSIKLRGIRLPAVTPAPPPPPPPSGAWPAWRNAMTTLNVFSPISGTDHMNHIATSGLMNVPSDITSRENRTIDAYCGMVAANNYWFTALNGGHDDSPLNPVLGIDLLQDPARWTVWHPGSLPSQYATNVPYYGDGLPSSRHTGYNLVFCPPLQRLLAVGSWGVWNPSGNSAFPYIDGFSLVTRTWDPQNTYAPSPVNDQVTSCACDPVTGNCYTSGGSTQSNTIWKWDRTAGPKGTWGLFAAWNATPPTYQSGSQDYVREYGNTAMIVDSTRDCLVGFFATPGQNMLQFFNLNGPTICVSRHLSAQITAQPITYPALVHDLDNNRYVIAVANSVWGIDPNNGQVTPIATVTPGYNGTYTRLAYFPTLGGIAYLSDYASPIQFMPTRSTA